MAVQSKVQSGGGSGSPVLIIGIDPGTTSFKVAILVVEEVGGAQGNLQLTRQFNDHVIVLENFPGDHRFDLSHSSTSLIYDKHSHKLSKWGHLATNFQTHESFDSNYLVNHWKLAVHKSSSPAARQLQQTLEAAARRLNKTPESFIEDFFRALRSYLLESDDSVLLEHLSMPLSCFKYIDVVIALPPGWSRHEHRIFTHAATVGLGEIPNLRLFTASETECVLRSWASLNRYQGWLKSGDIIMLLDLGGGTACISVFGYEAIPSEGERWAHMESHSLSAGSEMVTEEFIKDLRDRLEGVRGLPNMSQILHRARLEFEQRKKEVGENEEEEYWYLRIDGLKPNSDRGFEENRVRFTREQLLSYFQPSQNLLFAKFTEVSNRVAATYKKPRGCIVAGAYAKNVIFRKRFKAANILGMEVFYPQSISELVVRGACHGRVDGEFRQFSGSRYSIGVKTYITEKNSKKTCHAANRLKFHRRKFDGDRHNFYPAISWPIKKTQQVDIDHEIPDSPSIRYFEPEEEIQFTDTIFISESHPGSAKYTVLKYNTADPALWKENRRFLREKNIVVEAMEITWSINQTVEEKCDGTAGPYERSALPEDPKDMRRTKRRFLVYKYYFHISQTDCRISIEAFFTHTRSNKMEVGSKQIIVLDGGEHGSVALPEEYANLPDDTEDGQESADDLETYSTSNQPGGCRRGRVQRTVSNFTKNPRHHKGRIGSHSASLPGSIMSGFEGSSIDHTESETLPGVSLSRSSRPQAKRRHRESSPSSITENAADSAQYLREVAFAADQVLRKTSEISNIEASHNGRLATRSARYSHSSQDKDFNVPPIMENAIIPSRSGSSYMTRGSISRTSSPLSYQIMNVSDSSEFEPDNSSNDESPKAKKSCPSLRQPVAPLKRRDVPSIETRRPRHTYGRGGF